MNMKHSRSHLPEEARSVHLLTIHDFSVTAASSTTDCIKSRCTVDGYAWELRLYPTRFHLGTDVYLELELVFLGEPRRQIAVAATLQSRLVGYQSCGVEPRDWKVSKTFCGSSDCPLIMYIGKGSAAARDVQHGGGSSLTVECTITVVRDPFEDDYVPLPLPHSLHRDLGDLLDSQVGADVTLSVVSGDSFPRAQERTGREVRSPVFMAEFFGAMAEQSSQSQQVEIKDMDAQVLRAMLRFIYTDMEPEVVSQQGAEKTAMTQHLLVAADRYGLDRLKVICEQRLSVAIDVETAASTLALAEQHNSVGLKGKCIEFIAGSPENLDAVLATEGYRHLEASCPSVLTELLKAANGRRRSRS